MFKYCALFVAFLALANVIINLVLKDYIDLAAWSLGLVIWIGITYHEFTGKFATHVYAALIYLSVVFGIAMFFI